MYACDSTVEPFWVSIRGLQTEWAPAATMAANRRTEPDHRADDLYKTTIICSPVPPRGHDHRLGGEDRPQGFGLRAVERADGALLGLAGLNPVPPGIATGEGLEIGWRLARHA